MTSMQAQRQGGDFRFFFFFFFFFFFPLLLPPPPPSSFLLLLVSSTVGHVHDDNTPSPLWWKTNLKSESPPAFQGWRSSGQVSPPPPPKQTPWRRPCIHDPSDKSLIESQQCSAENQNGTTRIATDFVQSGLDLSGGPGTIGSPESLQAP